ncbi:MAG: putative type I restriction enzymeP M protein [Firmicutes bacterium ADurb.Bin419]|nr:MAG: putative type I restriction enzymeP M protein [Firmicutes bacterium ADurb.Bin419]
MEAIEKDNPSLKGVLPKEYAKEKLDKQSLGGLIDLIGTIALGDSASKSKDILGRVYEYFLGQFALAEGKKGGQFYTPSCVVSLLVEMLEPYEGRVFDPCCGSGGLFVQSEKFILAHSDRYSNENKGLQINPIDRISIYGQESNQTTWRLCKMNLAIRSIDSSNVKWNNEGSFLNDAHMDLKADYIIANPPFNDKDWSGELLKNDYRWRFGIPPFSNANYAWIQHFIHHLSSKGKAGFLLATKALASESQAETEIRKKIIQDNLVECIVLLPGKLFYTTPAPVSLWVLSRGKKNNNTLFIDASKIFTDIDRTHRMLSLDNIMDICNVYHSWLKGNNSYKDISGYCKAVSLEKIIEKGGSLYPGDYIGIEKSVSDKKNIIEAKNIALNELSTISNNVDDLMKIATSFKKMVENELENEFSQRHIELKLSEILIESTEVLGSEIEPEILTCTENAGLVLQRERFSKRVATEDTSSYKIVRKTDIVYNPYLLWAGAIDQCWVVDIGITSPAYVVLNLRDGFEPLIIGHILKSDYMKKWYWNISIGTHERRRTAPIDKFLNLTVNVPDFNVQKRIKTMYQEMMNQFTMVKSIKESLDVSSLKLNEYFTGV